jgi:predicted outer membrane repeat protein
MLAVKNTSLRRCRSEGGEKGGAIATTTCSNPYNIIQFVEGRFRHAEDLVMRLLKLP